MSGSGLASSPIGKQELNWECDGREIEAMRKAEGSGSGMTKADFERANKNGWIAKMLVRFR